MDFMDKEKKIRRIGVLTSGGDAPGMNAAIRAVVRACRFYGVECLGIRRGYNGLINGDVYPMRSADVNGIINRGGTMLYSARCPEFMKPEGQKRAADTCKYLGIDGLIGIGGDGTFRGLNDLAKFGVSTIGIPATIDNDIACTDYTLGFDTACNTALDCIDKLRDTMQSHDRCSVVEVMGRHAGHLALYVGLAGGASAILVPEIDESDDEIIEKIRNAKLSGRTHFIIVVAEGEGRSRADEVAKTVIDATGMDTRVTILGHVQRGGAPSVRDRVMAARMGEYAVRILTEGKSNCIVADRQGELCSIDIVEALGMKKSLRASMFTAAMVLTGSNPVEIETKLAALRPTENKVRMDTGAGDSRPE